jgi:hypothetical protein
VQEARAYRTETGILFAGSKGLGARQPDRRKPDVLLAPQRSKMCCDYLAAVAIGTFTPHSAGTIISGSLPMDQ